MWQAVTDAVGISSRDSLWDYPDLMPTAEDIDDPSALVARLQAVERGEQPVADEFDEALARLLDGDDFSSEKSGDGAAEPNQEDTSEDDGDAAPEGDRPV